MPVGARWPAFGRSRLHARSARATSRAAICAGRRSPAARMSRVSMKARVGFFRVPGIGAELPNGRLVMPTSVPGNVERRAEAKPQREDVERDGPDVRCDVEEQHC
jgi:hypothetical protein